MNKNKFLTITICCGIPSSGKSTWSIGQVSKDPEGTVRINRDSIRNMLSNYHYSDKNEKLVTKVCDDIFKQALKARRNIILDNTNLRRENFDDICKIVKDMNIDAIVMEKPFYVELDEALLRNSKREGSAKVPEDVIHKMWKKSGGKQHKFYKPKCETFYKQPAKLKYLQQDITLPKAIISDVDGTIAEISHRDPYDTSKCLNDVPIEHVVNLVKMFYNKGTKIIFCSGREDKYKDLTSEWLDTYVGVKYELFMRPTGNFEKDSIIKEQIYNNIKDKYYIEAVLDDRLQVCKLWNQLSLPLLRVGDPEAIF